MLELPFKYKGLFDRDYEIIGWRGSVLQTRTGGRVFTLTRADTLGLLKSLGLNESDIPGYWQMPMVSVPKFSMEIE